jgi:hypothetical protein
MTEPVILREFDVVIEPGEVGRLLGAANESRRLPDGRLGGIIDSSIERARELLSTAGIYVIASGSDLAGSTVFEGLERLAYCVCTIGPELETEVTRLSKGDELTRAVVLDAAGSVAAEAVAEHMDRSIREAAALEGLKTSCRASPGYGDWDVSEQRALFRIVPAGRIGVRLSESAMMIPRKSVSFAVHIAEHPARMRSENSCRNCDHVDCPYRLLE